MDHRTAIVRQLETWQPGPGVRYRFEPYASRRAIRVRMKMSNADAMAWLNIKSPPAQVHDALDTLQAELIKANAEGKLERELKRAHRQFLAGLREIL